MGRHYHHHCRLRHRLLLLHLTSTSPPPPRTIYNLFVKKWEMYGWKLWLGYRLLDLTYLLLLVRVSTGLKHDPSAAGMTPVTGRGGRSAGLRTEREPVREPSRRRG